VSGPPDPLLEGRVSALSQEERSEPLPSATPRRGLSLHAVTWALLIFSFLNFAGVTIAIWCFFPADIRATSPAYAARFALRHAGDDSWKPMLLAHEVVRAPGTKRVYRSLFFDQKVKFQYPPSSLLAIELLEWLFGRPVSLGILNIISWFCVLALAGLVPAIYLHVLRNFSPDVWGRFTRLDLGVQAAVLSLMTLSFYPLTRGFVLGQIQTWLTCLFAGAVLGWARGHRGLSGALIGLIVAAKPQLALLFLWGALQRSRGFLIGFGTVTGALELLSLWRYGHENHVDYLSVLAFLSVHGESLFANQSVNGLLARLLHTGNSVQWDAHGFPPYHPVVYYGTLVSSCLMIGTALVWRRKEIGRRATLVKLLVAGLLFTMASPIAWEHHYGILLPVYAVMFALLLGGHSHRKLLVCLAVSYVASSNSFRFTNLAAETPWNFVQSYLLAAAALLLLIIHLHELRAPRAGSSSD
jgi:alpha-1,2-mannosyltransferase